MARRNILIVEDDEQTREVYKSIIEKSIKDVLVVIAIDGSDAMRKIRNQVFDIMITDIKMPRIDGEGLLKNLEQFPKETKPRVICVISGFVTPEMNGKTIGPVTYFAKPLEGNVLIEFINKKLSTNGTEPPKPQTKIDVSFILPFIEGTISVLNTMCNLSVTKEKVFMRTDDQISGDISAVVSMNSDTYTGSMAIAFETQCYLSTVGGMVGQSYKEITPEITDAAGEICNQIFGFAKHKLNTAGHTLKPAVASIVVGKGHRIKHLVSGTPIAIQFKSPAGNLIVEAVIQSTKNI